MKKTLKILVVVCSMLLLAGAFSSCAKKIPTDSAYSKLRDALESSLQYKTYYIQEMITHDKLLDKTTVNLRCKLDKIISLFEKWKIVGLQSGRFISAKTTWQ